MPTAGKGAALFPSGARERIARGFTLVEDVVYVGLGLLLAGAALVLLVSLGPSAAACWPVPCPAVLSAFSTRSS